MVDDFDFDKALKPLQTGKTITGKDGVLPPLIKRLPAAPLDAELVSTRPRKAGVLHDIPIAWLAALV
jgi:hypothetical protein